MQQTPAGGIFPLMETTFRQALESALKASGRSLLNVAAASGVSYEQLKSLRQGKSQRTNVDDAIKVAVAFGVSLEDFYSGNLSLNDRQVAVAGRVGAGAEVMMYDDHAKGDGLYHVICPPLISPRGVVAVEVLGDSMEPVYFEGDVLFYARQTMGVPTEAIGRPCICVDTEGFAWVKQVKIGTAQGLFNLLSINPTGSNRLDVSLAWAAPVLLHLPKALVTRA